jgi:hypothetical protein
MIYSLPALEGLTVVFYALVVEQRNGFLPWMVSCGLKSERSVGERKLTRYLTFI